MKQPIDVTTGDAICLAAIAKSFQRPVDRLLGRSLARTGTEPVLRDITLRVCRGEIMGLVGSNGAGKTTLLEILATVQLPTGGSGVVGGYDLLTESLNIRRIIGYCPASDGGFYPTLTGQANLEFFGALGGLSPRDAAERAEAVLDVVGGSGLGLSVFQRFSAGMRQKLALARALVADPPILLLDEPTRSLDPSTQTEFHHLLRRVLVETMGKTILLVTHDRREMHALCNRVACLRGGIIAGVGRPAEVQPDPRGDRPVPRLRVDRSYGRSRRKPDVAYDVRVEA
jgi:ABC-2 type transport system ATP-binding protein